MSSEASSGTQSKTMGTTLNKFYDTKDDKTYGLN